MDISPFIDKIEKIGIVGLGYVGLPLALLMSKVYQVIGYDLHFERVEELKKGVDRNNEFKKDTILNGSITYTNSPVHLNQCKIIIITVPTPVDQYKNPDLKPIKTACCAVGKILSTGSTIVLESTVYPGLTEEVVVSILETESGLKWKTDFNVGYSPERINPGDQDHSIDRIKKVVAGDTIEAGEFLAKIYGQVITAGIHLVSDIRTAEAAKIIENIQRDINIALLNELSIIFNKMSIDTHEVLEAAKTKWNFLNFEPGLVGGHCIGVDPYYLTFKAESLGYIPQVILSGRRINDSMGKFVAENLIKLLNKTKQNIKKSKVLILGITFKENIGDIRNTKVIDIIKELSEYDIQYYVYDPYASTNEVYQEFGIQLINSIEDYKPYSAIVLAVKHKKFIEKRIDEFKNLMNGDPLIFLDVKGVYNKNNAEELGFLYWRL